MQFSTKLRTKEYVSTLTNLLNKMGAKLINKFVKLLSFDSSWAICCFIQILKGGFESFREWWRAVFTNTKTIQCANRLADCQNTY